jgi:PDZ domain-containing protein
MTAPIVPSPGEDQEEPPTAGEPGDVLDDDEGTGVATGDDPAGRRPRRSRRWWIVAILGLALAGLVAASFLVQLPYYLVQPGSVRPAEQRVDVEGAPAFETDGEVLFTTVFLSRATPALMVRAWLDDAVEVRTEEEMYPQGDRDQSQRLNRERMDLSKLTATRVALDRVGVDATYSADGARVLGVVEDGPSEGLIGVDDVVVQVDGGEVAMPADISGELGDRAPGDTVEVGVRRGGKGTPEDVQVRLGESGQDPGRPILGIEVEPANPTIDADVEVEVDSGEVSGPSAGLAWTLAIIDRLTPGSLTGGRRIAVTGEILDDGSVGPIGGITQKVAAVKRAGIRTFIYPASTPEDEQRTMRKVAGDDVDLWPVATVDEAIERLAPDGLPSAN